MKRIFKIQNSHQERKAERERVFPVMHYLPPGSDPPISAGIKAKQKNSISLLWSNTKHYLGIDFAYLSPELLIGSSEASPLHLTLPCCLDSTELWGKQHVSPVQSELLNHALSGNCPPFPPLCNVYRGLIQKADAFGSQSPESHHYFFTPSIDLFQQRRHMGIA